METIEKEKKVERVREFHETSSSRLKDFRDSRLAFSKDNYQHKVVATLQEKERARTVLEQLRQEEERLLADVKHSEQAMLTSLYSLETVNPEHRKRFRSDKGKPDRRRDEDYYSHESFDA
jgi:CTP synthase (UTP-ammonia lyase)